MTGNAFVLGKTCFSYLQMFSFVDLAQWSKLNSIQIQVIAMLSVTA